MSIQYDALIREVLALPSNDRALLAETVIDSLHEEDANSVRAAWIDEIESRLAATERGDAKYLPGDEVMASLRKKLTT
jgi:putative addiction module component (TIGR02574 family)